MKILVFAHRLELGGTQTNAIELSAALRDLHGHEVLFFATPGPMVKQLEEKGLRFVPAPDARFHPSMARMRALRSLVRSERPDVLHVWDWWQCLDAYWAVHLLLRTPMVVTDMMMDLTRVLPKAIPTTFGTPELVDQARAAGRRDADLLLPPVDVHANAPGAVDGEAFRARHGISADECVAVTVSRLSHWLKSESLLRTIEVVRALGREWPLRFVIAGDGAVRPRLESLASEVNAELGRPAVVLTGALVDSRPAYAAADIVVGMGGSALRAMAFAKPVVVVGAGGFAAPFDRATAESFLYQGMYGRGDGSPGNVSLLGAIRGLLQDPARREDVGRFAREFVVRHFSLETASARLDAVCRSAAASPPGLGITAADGLRTAAIYLRERRFLMPSRDREPAPPADTTG